ncbi:MAG TPA: hypothetical protein ENG74_02130, partial [Thermoplasmatales archaeon]|nr:hypothetical protein [Thermoplasmatales archaeon]
VILLIAAAGVYFYKPAEEKPFIAAREVLNVLGGVMKDVPNAIEVADSSPFYALIATPLAVHYDKEGDREIIPMYIKNMTNPSRAVIRTEQMVGRFIDLVIDGKKSPKEVSLELAEKYWGKSDLALIIKDDKEGYEVGLVATPIASYLSVPVIVTDKIDSSVIKTLSKLKVRYILICGNLSTNAFKSYKIETPDDALNITIDLVEEKFGKVGYITLANPIDAWPPRVLDKKTVTIGPVEIPSICTTQFVRTVFNFLFKGGEVEIGNFTIPDDYKYALIKFEGINLDSDEVDELRDAVLFYVGIDDPSLPESLQTRGVVAGGTNWGGIPVRDANGHIVKDRFYTEAVLYDMGGKRCKVTASGTWFTRSSGRVMAVVEIDKLGSPVYAMAKKLSVVAPYLTAYHRGILFAREDFAFAPDDNVLTKDMKRCPGYYTQMRNPRLAEPLNRHVFDKIHKPLNALLAKIAGIDLSDLKSLRDHYKNNPIYIALVGDAVVLPQIVYQNYMEPIDEEDPPAYTGGGTPSDFIYGNIDPIPYDWSNLANDTYSYYPYQENIVGRIIGWDAQDVSALVNRVVFYNDIIEKLGDWKETAANLVGGGQDFQRPLVRYFIFGTLLGLTPRGEPMKYWTGYGEMCMKRTTEKVLKPMGFKVLEAYDAEAALCGYSDEALNKIKKSSLLNRIFFRESYMRKLIGRDAVKGREYIKKSNFIWINAHGNQHAFIAPGPSLVAAGFGGPILHKILLQIVPNIMGGFVGPGYSLSSSDYDTRSVENLELGPSFIWIESCTVGRIEGVYPTESGFQAFIHAGAAAIVASSTGSNIAGGYLEPKRHKYDLPWTVWKAYINTTKNMKEGEYPDPHFGYLFYQDMCKELLENKTLGLAFRNARNAYLPKDANWTLWWNPPLPQLLPLSVQSMSHSDSGKFQEMAGKKMRMLKAKYITFQEYALYGDPALNPYVPGETNQIY